MRSAMLRSCVRMAFVASGVVAVVAATSAGPFEGWRSKVAPPDERYLGRTYGQWSARQWQWLFSMPVDRHPLFDTADIAEGQSGLVWFLGGSYASSEIEPGVILGQADRVGTIPFGTSLFFPMVAAECSEVEGYGSTRAELRECANFFADFIDPSSVFLEIDGEAVTDLDDFRVESPLFTFGPLPENNVQQFTGVDAPAGTRSPAVSDGYFAMVKPLSVGTHTIRFGGVIDVTSIGGPYFIQDFTYTITVVPRGRYCR